MAVGAIGNAKRDLVETTFWRRLAERCKSLVSAFAIVFARGREALLAKLEADTKLKQIEVEERKFELTKNKIDYLFGLATELHRLDAPERLRDIVDDEVALLLSAALQDDRHETRGVLVGNERKRTTRKRQ